MTRLLKPFTLLPEDLCLITTCCSVGDYVSFLKRNVLAVFFLLFLFFLQIRLNS